LFYLLGRDVMAVAVQGGVVFEIAQSLKNCAAECVQGQRHCELPAKIFSSAEMLK
jgi:hypothetical protein